MSKFEDQRNEELAESVLSLLQAAHAAELTEDQKHMTDEDPDTSLSSGKTMQLVTLQTEIEKAFPENLNDIAALTKLIAQNPQAKAAQLIHFRMRLQELLNE